MRGGKTVITAGGAGCEKTHFLYCTPLGGIKISVAFAASEIHALNGIFLV